MADPKRYIADIIEQDALRQGKMAFVTGPRQVGKSTLAKSLLQSTSNYFLYDEETFRRAWAKSPSAALAQREPGLIVLDEIHKDRRWKTKLKGLYDTQGASLPIVVTGSARFDVFRKGSDSLLGRYLPYRLHPFSVAEDAQPCAPDALFSQSKVNFTWSDLLQLGGFPEPLLRGSQGYAQRWSRLRLDRLVYEDTRDFRTISDINAMALLAELLPERVGSLLSVNALREDLSKAYATVRAWVAVLDILYFSFTIKPYARRLNRAIRAEPKLYLYDIVRIPQSERAKRMENLVALHLLKACQYWTDTAQGEFELRFVRTKDGREVDFLLLRDKQPWMLVECKSNAKTPASDLVYFQQKIKPAHAFQLVTDEGFDRVLPAYNIRILGYEKFFSGWL